MSKGNSNAFSNDLHRAPSSRSVLDGTSSDMASFSAQVSSTRPKSVDLQVSPNSSKSVGAQ
eukprot:5589940-Ditylum_brightwellii.AAC.1